MSATQPTSYKSAFWVLAGLTALLLIGLLWKYYKADLDLIAYISGISTLAIALLTAAYVFTTNNQLSVMKGQLDEMRNSREYQAQPLPIFQDVEVSIEKPRFFIRPHLTNILRSPEFLRSLESKTGVLTQQ